MEASTLQPRRLLEDLCALDSTTGREAALLPALLPALEALGARVEVHEFSPGRCNVLATWGEPRILFSTHLDTVPPFLPPRWEGGTLFARGACDAKGQIVAQLLAAEALRESGVAWLGVAGEETDSLGAQEALTWKDRFRSCRALINGEPTELKVATGQRGVKNLRLRCTGTAAHGGSPELGHNAILELLDWLEGVRRIPLGRDPDLGPEVWNLGTIQGGEAVNIVPDRAQALLNVRTVPGSSFQARVEALRPTRGEVDLLVDEPPSLYPALAGFDRAFMPFGSDAPCLRALIPGLAAALAGPGSIRVAHTENEHLTMQDLAAGADLNLRLARHFLQEQP
ncbi:M20 family metallopeptidase [Mesoterricola silvestris]|uniref:Peptidase M20 n=1 Tax=Mesoterricola silvestris TaxID=2927979 RepID=A0AA48K810_9BACT|nr:M20/M25/M40 family metallo-hydrolase [Mesoterricola silvestris]BDU71645.1 peptidase M20 [Mesoterricola silvestris]